ncbi:MAG TPA: deoxyribodipyrimidine photo-lyase [Caulobacteraceae bacterium]
MIDAGPVIVWFRRDLRLADNPALATAAASGRPVIPIYILDETPGLRRPGGASRWWLDKSLRALAASLEALGSRLILRRGPAAAVLEEMIAQTGASAVFWNRLYDGGAVERDMALKKVLAAETRSFNAALLNEPWEVKTGTGKDYSVFTPYWRAARGRLDKVDVLPARRRLTSPEQWPDSDGLSDWKLHPTNPDWSEGFSVWTPGEAGARRRLDTFLSQSIKGYGEGRDRPDIDQTSRLSPHLHFGEIGPRQVWVATQTLAATGEAALRDTEKFLSELGWREFNHHVLFHHPQIATENLKGGFGRIPWRKDIKAFRAWTEGRTGYPLVDAGMRELWATGFMHNRVRMVAASFLVKHLLIDWREGERWFWDTLVDADLANNAANWQWVAGCGADASPWFRVFNPQTQAEKFDPDGAYVRRWVPEFGTSAYPAPIVDHAMARKRALAALGNL